MRSAFQHNIEGTRTSLGPPSARPPTCGAYATRWTAIPGAEQPVRHVHETTVLTVESPIGGSCA